MGAINGSDSPIASATGHQPGRARCGATGAAADGSGGTPILGDERLREALDLVASRADAQGRWRLQQTFNDRFVVPIETKGEPSRWVTLRALEVAQGASPMREPSPH
jgi:hypothetical protein